MTGSWAHSGNQITITINSYVTSDGEEVYEQPESIVADLNFSQKIMSVGMI